MESKNILVVIGGGQAKGEHCSISGCFCARRRTGGAPGRKIFPDAARSKRVQWLQCLPL